MDSISETINNINVTLAVNTDQLTQHIKRTNLLEAQIQPLKKHVNMVEGGFKALGFISLLLGIAVAIIKLLAAL